MLDFIHYGNNWEWIERVCNRNKERKENQHQQDGTLHTPDGFATYLYHLSHNGSKNEGWLEMIVGRSTHSPPDSLHLLPGTQYQSSQKKTTAHSMFGGSKDSAVENLVVHDRVMKREGDMLPRDAAKKNQFAPNPSVTRSVPALSSTETALPSQSRLPEKEQFEKGTLVCILNYSLMA